MKRLEDIPGWFITLPTAFVPNNYIYRELRVNGLSHIKPFYGFDAKVMGLKTTHTFELDNPGTGYTIKQWEVGCYLSHYVLWVVIREMGFEETIVLENDAQFVPDWRERWDEIRDSVPEDWDMILIGSCNCMDKEIREVSNGLFVVKYPQCTHGYIVRQKAIPRLILHLEKVYAPVDIGLTLDAYPNLSVYTVLPRLVNQAGTFINP